MKEFRQYQKVLSVLMIFILLTEFSGCMSYRVIPTTDLPDYAGYQHSVYTKKSLYIVDSTNISGGILIGFLDPIQTRPKKSVHIYVLSDSLININKMNSISFPMSDVNKIMVPRDYLSRDYVFKNSSGKSQKERMPAGKTILTVLYAIAGFSIIGSLSWMIFENKRR